MGYEKGKAHNDKSKRGKSSGAGNKDRFDFRFVRYVPVKSDKERLRVLDVTGVEALVKLVLTTESGYKLSISFDEEHETYVASLTGVKQHCANRGFILTGRGADSETAVRWLYYLHFIAFEESWVDQSEVEDWEL